MKMSDTTIYYFSATGNSLTFARRLAAELGGTELVSISKAMKQGNVNVRTSNIGLIFPVYAWGPPRMVEEFIEKLNPEKVQYVFAVATCGGIAGGTMVQVRKMLRKNGADLNAGFVVKAASYPLSPDPGIVRMMKRISDPEKYTSADDRFEEIVKVVKSRGTNKLEKNSFFPSFFGSMFHDPAIKAFKNTASGLGVNDNCKGCGTCANICLRDNIEIVDKRPVWGDDCEGCLACAQWCPNAAIENGMGSLEGKQGHNQEVKLKDMITALCF